MKKKYITQSKSEEEVEVCTKCLVEVEHGETDWDSYSECPNCHNDDYTKDLKTKWVKKVREYTVYYIIP